MGQQGPERNRPAGTGPAGPAADIRRVAPVAGTRPAGTDPPAAGSRAVQHQAAGTDLVDPVAGTHLLEGLLAAGTGLAVQLQVVVGPVIGRVGPAAAGSHLAVVPVIGRAVPAAAGNRAVGADQVNQVAGYLVVQS